MADRGLSDRARILRLPGPEHPDAEGLREILAPPDRPRAILCRSRSDAVPLRNPARQRGLRLPEDRAIPGHPNNHHDNPVPARPMIGLAPVDQDGPRPAPVAAEALLSRIAGRRTAQQVPLVPALIARGSV